MKKVSCLIALVFILAGCGSGGATKATSMPQIDSTEIPCPGVEPRGLTVGMQAYVSLNAMQVSVDLFKEPDSTEKTGSVVHHIRVDLQSGPKCASDSAWWLIQQPDGSKGWLQVGKKVNTILEPYKNDAVQREVVESRKKEAQVRYITADIELGGAEELKYYLDQVAAKPDDPESEIMKIALDIVEEAGGKRVLANASAFERKPLRGGTSVVDAGTEYVQPGLDILLIPCDQSDPSPVCDKMNK